MYYLRQLDDEQRLLVDPFSDDPREHLKFLDDGTVAPVSSEGDVTIATLELKNAMTGQTVEEARRQYKQDRDPRETIFEFKKRALVRGHRPHHRINSLMTSPPNCDNCLYRPA